LRTAPRARRRCAVDARGPVGGLALTCLPAALGEHREHPELPELPGRHAAGRGSHTDRRGRRDRHRTPIGRPERRALKEADRAPPAAHRECGAEMSDISPVVLSAVPTVSSAVGFLCSSPE